MAAKSLRSKSRLLWLPRDILEQVNRMLVEVGEGRKTYEQIAEWVISKGFQTSKSAIHRYARWMNALEKVKLVGEQARAIIDDTGEDPMRIEEATAKLGAVVMMEVFQEAMRGDRIDVHHIGRLMGDFAKLQSSSILRERLKDDFRGKLDKAADEVVKAVKKQGLSEEKAAEIRKKILGVVS
jgi:hypothetical protein